MRRHPLLQRQLDRLGLCGADAPSSQAWRALLDDVSTAYAVADRAALPVMPTTPGREAGQAKDARTAEHEKLSAVIESLGEGLLVLDGDLRVESINRQGEEILRTPADKMLGRPIEELATSWSLRDRGPYAVSKMRHHLLRGIPYRNDEAFVVAEEGAIIHVSLVMTPIERHGQRVGAVICFRDITSLKVAENRLRESEERFRRIFKQAPTGMIRIGADGKIAESNQAFQEMLGCSEEELAGISLAQLWHPDEAAESSRLLALLLAGEQTAWQAERRFTHADGSTVWTTISMALVRSADAREPFVIGVVEDETERKRLEVELRHAQKLESVGRLAAGIAHEINTPIQYIGDNVHFIGEAFEKVRHVAADPAALAQEESRAELEFLADEVPLAVRQTLDGVERVASIVRAMKGFGCPDAEVRSLADVNEAVQSTIVVARSELKYVADVETDLGDLPLVPCFVGDLKQVFLNLLVNAAHAIADVAREFGTRGRIRVVTRCRGDGVEIAVSDSGGGIAPDIRDRIFDPFFTTKEVGQGSGQGLALAHAVVVDRHGGELTFETEVGAGSTFRVWLPLHPDRTGAATRAP